MKPVGMVDCDGVLLQYFERFVQYMQQYHGSTVELSDLVHTNFKGFFDMPLMTYYHALGHYQDSDLFHTTPPIEGAHEALFVLSQHYELHVCTHRPLVLESSTETQMDEHFPGIFSRIHHTDLANKTTKAQLCEEHNAAFLIDDTPNHFQGLNGSLPVLFSRPWNHSHDHEPRVQGWEEALHVISRLEYPSPPQAQYL